MLAWVARLGSPQVFQWIDKPGSTLVKRGEGLGFLKLQDRQYGYFCLLINVCLAVSSYVGEIGLSLTFIIKG